MAVRDHNTLRSLKELKTQSGKTQRSDVPYMAFMKISCLEMEKARREKERESAETRIRNIDLRIAEIEKEKAALLSRIGERPHSASSDAATQEHPLERSAETERRPTDAASARGFRIRY